MRITDRDNASHTDAARIIGIGLWAAVRRGHVSARDEARIEQILDRADVREEKKADIRQTAQAAREKAKHEAKKQRAVERATRRYR
jgi:hypothetical protein